MLPELHPINCPVSALTYIPLLHRYRRAHGVLPTPRGNEWTTLETAHHLYMTVNDARPLGNERCRKTEPTRMYCDICWHVDRVLRRELSSHVCVDCPYSRLVIDALMRSLLSLYSPDQPTRDHWTTCTSAYLTDAVECLFHTGSSVGCPLPTPPLVATNLAGCLQQVLFERAERNAPRHRRPNPDPDSNTSRNPNDIANSSPPASSPISYPDHAICFDPHTCYARVVSLLASRLDHTRRFSSDQDDNLACLYPGIEPWLAEHGHLPDWHKEGMGHSNSLPTPNRPPPNP